MAMQEPQGLPGPSPEFSDEDTEAKGMRLAQTAWLLRARVQTGILASDSKTLRMLVKVP